MICINPFIYQNLSQPDAYDEGWVEPNVPIDWFSDLFALDLDLDFDSLPTNFYVNVDET